MIHKEFNVIQFMSNKTWFLAPIELYIIIKIRLIRLELDINSEEISLFLKKNKKYIGNIESAAHNAKYSDEILNSVAIFFSERAKKKQKDLIKAGDNTIIKTDYIIHDFYPTEILSDEKVVKEVPPIPVGLGPTGTLNGLIESTDFFKTARTLKEIVDKVNKVQNQHWKASNLTQPLENAVKGKNIRLEVAIRNDLNTYILAKKQKNV